MNQSPKYVSGRLYVNAKKHWTLPQAVQAIQQDVRHKLLRSNEYYNTYPRYLTTPAQKTHSINQSHEELVSVVERNLVQYNVMIGIVERMGDSLALIQSIVDVNVELTDHMQSLDTSSSSTSVGSNKSKKVVQNKSALSTRKSWKSDDAIPNFMP